MPDATFAVGDTGEGYRPVKLNAGFGQRIAILVLHQSNNGPFGIFLSSWPLSRRDFDCVFPQIAAQFLRQIGFDLERPIPEPFAEAGDIYGV